MCDIKLGVPGIENVGTSVSHVQNDCMAGPKTMSYMQKNPLSISETKLKALVIIYGITLCIADQELFYAGIHSNF